MWRPYRGTPPGVRSIHRPPHRIHLQWQVSIYGRYLVYIWQVSAAYIALLIGFICNGKPALGKSALDELKLSSFVRVAPILKSFMDFQVEARLVSEEVTKRAPRRRLRACSGV